MAKRIMAAARVQVTLEIRPSDSWDEKCNMDQVYSQGSESAIGYLRHMLAEDIKTGKVSFVGEPKTVVVLVEREKQINK